jgi:hypothetical protein
MNSDLQGGVEERRRSDCVADCNYFVLCSPLALSEQINTKHYQRSIYYFLLQLGVCTWDVRTATTKVIKRSSFTLKGAECVIKLQDHESEAVCSPQPFIVVRVCTGMEWERRRQREIRGSLNL